MSFKEWMKEGFQQEVEARSAEKQRVKDLKKQGVPICPKCKSQSLQYVERRKMLSVGRAITGGALLGPVGAGFGAVTSKKRKGFIKCLNCGHEWKK